MAGVLASLYGTWALLEAEDRALLKGYIINKFRGDAALLGPGLQEITTRTGLANLGVMPCGGCLVRWRGRHRWTGGPPRRRRGPAGGRRRAAAPDLENSADIDALAGEPGDRSAGDRRSATCARAPTWWCPARQPRDRR